MWKTLKMTREAQILTEIGGHEEAIKRLQKKLIAYRKKIELERETYLKLFKKLGKLKKRRQ